VGGELELLFGRRGWLSEQPAAFRAVVRNGRIVDQAAGATVFLEGDAAGGVLGVVSGGIGILLGPPLLDPRLAHILRPGDWIGAGAMLRGGARRIGCVVLEPTRLLLVPLVALQAIGRADPDAPRRIAAMESVNAMMAGELAATLMIPDTARRLGATLLRVTRALEHDPTGQLPELVLSQAQLGEMANASRHRVNKILADFARAGWVEVGYNRVRILDAAGLAAFSHGDV
jgi:CRP-like cAMP-binding protein